MDHTELAAKIRLQAWLQEQKEYASSNLSVNEWCAKKNISRTTFFYRQRKLREAAANAISESTSTVQALTRFVQVPMEICQTSEEAQTEQPSAYASPTVMRISVGGAEIDIYSGICENHLKTVLEVLTHVK